MKILIPTAKELNCKAEKVFGEKLSKKTKSIINEFSLKTIDELKSIYKIKEDKAKEEYARWEKLTKQDADSYPALELFNGLMYRNIARQSFNEEDREYISNYVFITSALYGVINAYNPISEHRLDFLQKCKIGNTSLKNFWREDYDKVIENDDFIISILQQSTRLLNWLRKTRTKLPFFTFWLVASGHLFLDLRKRFVLSVAVC